MFLFNFIILIVLGLFFGLNCILMLSIRRNSKFNYIDILMDGYFKWIGFISVDLNFNNIIKVNLLYN